MSSLFESVDKIKSDRKSLFGDSRPQPHFLQFTPGVVTAVVTSEETGTFADNLRNINSILAKPHYGTEFYTPGLDDEKNRYYPLLRGIVDVPTIGDPVLLCSFDEVGYYLGPLNTQNSPNYNVDHVNLRRGFRRQNNQVIDFDKDGFIKTFSDTLSKSPSGNTRDVIGLSRDFMRISALPRMQKYHISSLDDPREDKNIVANETGEKGEVHGDMILEGRHGNSIRIGSRDVNPYIFISNGRPLDRAMESTLDGSIFAMLETGTIHSHFIQDIVLEGDQYKFKPFVIASDTVEDSKRPMGSLVSMVNGDEDATKLIYEYELPQQLQSSDRITINARSDSLFLSALQNTHIGAGKSITFSANKDSIFDVSNIYLGKQAKTEKEEDKGQGLLLGENLRALLEHLVDILIEMNGHCQTAPIPLGFQMGTPGTLKLELQKIKTALTKDTNSFISTKHFIESEDKEYKATHKKSQAEKPAPTAQKSARTVNNEAEVQQIINKYVLGKRWSVGMATAAVDGYDLNKLALARDAYREGEIGIKDVTDEDWL